MAAVESPGPSGLSLPRPELPPIARDGTSSRGLRLLALDGGGVRGVSELYILEKLMERLKSVEGLGPNAALPLPCEVFDMICGTSTGGLIAIMLGRLRMSIEDCENAYGEFAKSVFNDPKPGLGFKEGRFKATNLKDAIMKIVDRKDKENDRMLDRRQNACKVFVCAMPASEMRRPRRFRTYQVNDVNEDCSIWEAARATSAAPTYFKPAEITIRPGIVERFVDGGLGCNNPVVELCDEAEQIFKNQKIDCIISIGTGTTTSQGLNRPSWIQNRFPLYVVPTLVDIANECETKHEITYRKFKDKPTAYYRFNVPGIGAMKLFEWKALSVIRQKTIGYLDGPEVDSSINAAASALGPPTAQLESSFSIQSNEQPQRLPSQFPTAPNALSSQSRNNSTVGPILQFRSLTGLLPSVQGTFAIRDGSAWQQENPTELNASEPRRGYALKTDNERQQKFLLGLKVDPDAVQNVKDKKGTRFSGTCEWFWDRGVFQNWNSNRGDQVLVIIAPPGQGKSVLAKYLLSQFSTSESRSGESVVLDYFCHGSPSQSTALSVVQSLLFQLLDTRRHLFQYVFPQYAGLIERGVDLTFEALWKIFVVIMKSPLVREAYCVMDGVDECDVDSQVLLLESVEKDFTPQSSDEPVSITHVRFLITSRPTAIATRLGRISNLYEIQNSDLDPDISRFVEYHVQKMTKAHILPDHLKSIVSSILSVGAEGMFLWVALNLEMFNQMRRGLSVMTMVEELNGIPKNVQAIYATAVEQIEKDTTNQDLAQRILNTLLFSFDSLTVKAFSIACNDWPDVCTLHSELEIRLDFNFEYSCKGACSSLIRFIDGTIQFCHPTARQFLLSDNSPITFNEAVCHLQLAITCLRYLLLEDLDVADADKNETAEELKAIGEDDSPNGSGSADAAEDKFPFLKYALRNWYTHLKGAGDSIALCPELLRQFFQIKHPRFRECLPAVAYFQKAFPDEPAAQDAMILHVLAFHNLFNILQRVRLITPKSQSIDGVNDLSSKLLQLHTDVNVRSSDGETPLLVAAARSSLETVQTLLGLDADPNAMNQEMETALHYSVRGSSEANVAVAKLLIPLADSLDRRNSSGYTPLLLTSSKEIAEMLLDYGADVNGERGEDGVTPLELAAIEGEEELVKLFLSKGASVNHRTDRNWTALYSAASQPQSSVVAHILKHKPEIHAIEMGWNALHVAAVRGYSDSVKLLLDHGIDVNCTTSNDRTALYIASEEGHDNVIKILLAANADVMKPEDTGLTPLHIAAAKGKDTVIELLIRWGAKVIQKSTTGVTPLYSAVCGGHLSTVKLLIGKGANKMCIEGSKPPMLHLAIHENYLDVAEYLIEENVDLESTWETTYTPLYMAAWKNRVSIAILLLNKGANPHCCNENGLTALHYFAENGHEELVQRLLDLGVSAKVETKLKWTPLHNAAQEGHLAVAKSLVSHGAIINAKTSGGYTSLSVAAQNGRIDFVKWLLEEQEADANDNSEDGWSPLYVAAHNGHLEIVELLLSVHANPKARSNTSVRPIYGAVLGGNIDVVNRLLKADPNEHTYWDEKWSPLSAAALKKNFQLIDILLEAGVRMDAKSPHGNKPFEIALESGDFDLTKRLISHVADPLKPTSTGNLPLVIAAVGGNLEIVNLLLELGADVNGKADRGHSALHGAAQIGSAAIVSRLLEKGADKNCQNVVGETALMSAASRGHTEAAEKLLNNGAKPNILTTYNATALHCASWGYWDSTIHVLLNHGADPVMIDSFGRSSMDWARFHEPSLKLMAEWLPSQISIDNEKQEKYLRSTIAILSDYQVKAQTEDTYFFAMLGHCLAFLEQTEDALVAFEQFVPESQRSRLDRGSVKHEIQCFSCSSEEITGIRYVCKTCADTDLCSTCMEKYKEGTTIRGCAGHEFFEVPRLEWIDFAPGTVNAEGETREKWLERLCATYANAGLDGEAGPSDSGPEPAVAKERVVQEVKEE